MGFYQISKLWLSHCSNYLWIGNLIRNRIFLKTIKVSFSLLDSFDLFFCQWPDASSIELSRATSSESTYDSSTRRIETGLTCIIFLSNWLFNWEYSKRNLSGFWWAWFINHQIVFIISDIWSFHQIIWKLNICLLDRWLQAIGHPRHPFANQYNAHHYI